MKSSHYYNLERYRLRVSLPSVISFQETEFYFSGFKRSSFLFLFTRFVGSCRNMTDDKSKTQSFREVWNFRVRVLLKDAVKRNYESA